MTSLFRRIQLMLAPPNSFRYKAVRRLVELLQKGGTESDLRLIRASNLFDSDWYLSNNPDVASAGVDPLTHYLRYGGFEGRDPGPGFSSRWYLDTYEDVRKAGINPLVHFLKYGKQEGRGKQVKTIEITNPLYKCPVCQKRVNEFLPLPAFYIENLQKYGFPYARDEGETINFEQYGCPHCGASDRERLYACYLDERIPLYPEDERILLLDIAPSSSLGHFFEKYQHIHRHTADLHMEDVDLVVDITHMPEIASDTYDILVCSHVLEHVKDDKKALSELYRVLKPEGWGIIMVPIILTLDQIDEDPAVTDIAERWRRFGQDDHVRLYSKRGFVERMEAAGFTVKQLGIDHFGEAVFRRYGITSTSVLYIAEKRKDNIPGEYQVSTSAGIPPSKIDSALLTVIVITYNHENSVAKALDSVLQQKTTYPYKIWLCDDCSTDGTLMICNDYAKRYPDRIEVFAQSVNTYSNPDKVFHVDTAIRNIDTKYYCILEGDDSWCNDNKIQIALEILENRPTYVTFAHDTLYNDIVNKTQKSLVHEIHRAEIQNPVLFESALYLHASSRIYRNVVKFSEDTERHGFWDIFLFYTYLDKGPLFYYDKIMSVYNITGNGLWSKQSKAEREKRRLFGQFQLNEYFHYRYDGFFTKRLGGTKTLELLKKISGKKMAWRLWFFMKSIEYALAKHKGRHS